MAVSMNAPNMGWLNEGSAEVKLGGRITTPQHMSSTLCVETGAAEISLHLKWPGIN